MELILERGRSERNYWRDLWRFRELFYILAWRDLTVRYKQTAIGVAWALLKPGLTMLVFVAFRKMTKLSSGGIPDPIFVLAALLPWMFFSTALAEAANSLIGNANLISKVYFPRIIVPAGAVVTSLVDFLITLSLMWYQFLPGWQIIMLMPLVLLTFALSVGAGLLLASLNVKYRDFRYIVPFIVQFGLFVSPIAISAADVPERWRFVYSLNPMVGIIDAFRWAICRGTPPLDFAALTMSVVVTVVFLMAGVWIFRRTEKSFADVI
jgi:lipopolysaccharide transport system permease protein